ncbi:hypothetical protein N9R79_07600 [Vibrio sp.]|nr:hypothetical protein [Vibrio sp.]
MTQAILEAEHHEVLKRPLSPLIQGCLEVLEQGVEFLDSINQTEYTTIVSSHFTSSIGEHFRHWLDLFHAVMEADDHIDYNLRRRGHPVESNLAIAQTEIMELMQRINVIKPERLCRPVTVTAEVTLSKTDSVDVNSTFERELSFAALHATHHYAMSKVIASLLNVKTSAGFGVAPATATYRRGQ